MFFCVGVITIVNIHILFIYIVIRTVGVPISLCFIIRSIVDSFVRRLAVIA